MNSGLAGFIPCDFGTVEKPFLMTLARGALYFFAVWRGELWNLRTETNGQLCCGRDAPLGGDVVHVGFVEGDGPQGNVVPPNKGGQEFEGSRQGCG